MDVHHDSRRQRFFVDLDAYEAFLVYAREGDTLDFYHVYVPDPYRGRGVADRILSAAFDHVGDNGLRVVVSCPFIAGEFLERHEVYRVLVEEGGFPFAEAE